MRGLRIRRLQDAPQQGGRGGARGGLHPQPRPRRGARGARATLAGACGTRPCPGRPDHDRARSLPAGRRGAPPGGPRPRDRRRLRGHHGLPVRVASVEKRVRHDAPESIGLRSTRPTAVAGPNLLNALAWFLVAFAIFNSYMLLWSTRVNFAVFGVFLTLQVTEVLLAIGFFREAHGHSAWMTHAAASAGIVTAALACYPPA